MRVLTIKAKPKTIFGVVLAITGVVVIILTFLGNHSGRASASTVSVNCASADEGKVYLQSLGWQCDDDVTQKEIVIPSTFNDVYTQYNEIQKTQGFDLENYKGKSAIIYTYNITNYDDCDTVIANLITCDDVLIGADLCNPSADDGFLVALSKK